MESLQDTEPDRIQEHYLIRLRANKALFLWENPNDPPQNNKKP